jgi:hypothetical protein
MTRSVGSTNTPRIGPSQQIRGWCRLDGYRTARTVPRTNSDGNPYWRCTTLEELESYLESIDRLHGEISENEYKSQRELLTEDPLSVRQRNTDAPHPILQEIGVNVHRDGTLAKKGAGSHRLALAQIAGVEQVPVTVRVRHAE